MLENHEDALHFAMHVNHDMDIGDKPAAPKPTVEQTEQSWFRGRTYGSFIFSVILVISTLVRRSLEIWITGVPLLTACIVWVFLWIIVIEPFISTLLHSPPDADWGWNSAWDEINVFVIGLLVFVALGVGTDLAYKYWEGNTATRMEGPAFLWAVLVVIYCVINYIRRVPGAIEHYFEM